MLSFFRQLWPQLRTIPGFKLCWAGVWACLGLQLITTAALVPLARHIERVFSDAALARVGFWLGAIVLLYIFRHGAEYGQQYLAGQLSLRWQRRWQSEAYGRLLAAPDSALRQIHPEETLSLFQDDTRQVQQGIYALLHRGLPSIALLSILVLALFYLSVLFTLVLLGLALCAHLLLRQAQRLLPTRAARLQSEVAALYHEMGEGMRGRFLVQHMHWQQPQKTRLHQRHKTWLGANLEVLKLQALERPVLGSLQVTVIAAVLFLCVLFVRQGWLSLGELVAFATAVALAVDPGLWWAETSATVRRAQASLTRLETAHWDPAEALVLYHQQPFCRLKNIELVRGEKTLLRLEKWDLPPGSKWALIGKSGQGKSSLLQSIAGVSPFAKGRVYWPEAWRKQAVVLVPQEAFFFHRTVRENLTGGATVSEEELWQVLHICQLSERFNHLAEGLDTLMGENGVYLSGGEKQRLAIARALLLRPALLLMDEATAEVDEHTEKQLFTALWQTYPDMICLATTHRMSLLPLFQKVWHLEQETLTEAEPHV